MIDYSIYTLPNPLDSTAEPKAYARAQIRESLSFKQFVSLLASRNSGFSRGAIEGVVSDACLCIMEQLIEGKKVQLGDLGQFWVSLSSNGAKTKDEFTANNIKGVNINFTPSKDFKNFVNRATFNPVSSREAQAATLKAEKAGSNTVDLR